MKLRRAVLSTVFVAVATCSVVPLSGAEAGPDDRRPCTPSLSTGTQTIQVTFEGQAYPVRVNVPPSAGRRQRLPMVLNLHYSNGNAEQQAAYTGLEAVGDREGFITVEPNGNIPASDPNPNKLWLWNVPGVPTTAGSYPAPDARDDIAYLTRVIDALAESGCADRERTYMTGHSGGARMASAYACARPEKIAAIGASAGLRAGRPAPLDPTVSELQTCRPGQPVPVITFHGDADTVNPYQGRPSDLRWGYSTPLAVQSWAQINRCTSGPAVTTVTPHVNKLAYSGCAGRAEVVLYKVAGGTHSWPGSPIDPGTTKEIDASTLMWQFFATHRRH